MRTILNSLHASELSLVFLLALMLAPIRTVAEERGDTGVWDNLLKDTYFKGKNIVEDKAIIELVTPYRAEDAALMPLSINAKIPQTEQRYIEKIYILVDKNPQPLVGIFTLTPALGRADLATRIRINQYTNVRAIAVLNNGEHHMAVNFVKAQGGCSAPLAADLQAAMQRLGQMRLRTVGMPKSGGPMLVNFSVRHPNITGMQMDQRTRLITPEHYVKTITLVYENKPLITAEVGFSMSADPSLRFFIAGAATGTVAAEIVDSKSLHFKEEFDLARLGS